MNTLKSNDNIPADEMILAKLIQNASVYGLKSCRGMYYKRADGTAVTEARKAAACCVIGAMDIDWTLSLRREVEGWMNIIEGNDSFSKTWSLDVPEKDGEPIGYYFYLIMKDG